MNQISGRRAATGSCRCSFASRKPNQRPGASPLSATPQFRGFGLACCPGWTGPGGRGTKKARTHPDRRGAAVRRDSGSDRRPQSASPEPSPDEDRVLIGHATRALVHRRSASGRHCHGRRHRRRHREDDRHGEGADRQDVARDDHGHVPAGIGSTAPGGGGMSIRRATLMSADQRRGRASLPANDAEKREPQRLEHQQPRQLRPARANRE